MVYMQTHALKAPHSIPFAKYAKYFVAINGRKGNREMRKRKSLFSQFRINTLAHTRPSGTIFSHREKSASERRKSPTEEGSQTGRILCENKFSKDVKYVHLQNGKGKEWGREREKTL